MKLDAFKLRETGFRILPASQDRDWMDATGSRFAYRCLPLTIANAYGWVITSPTGFVAIWDGANDADSIRIKLDGDGEPPATSHFGHGVLTFDLPFLFRTEPGFDLFVTGPTNAPKHGIGALSGIVETDWAPYTFSMNWRFTMRSRPVRFEAGEPCCQIFPIARDVLGKVQPRLLELGADADLEKDYRTWAAARVAFNEKLEQDQQAPGGGWQKDYLRGLLPDQSVASKQVRHLTKLNIRPFQEGIDTKKPLKEGPAGLGDV